MMVPAACVHSPRWVQVGVTTTALELGENAEDAQPEDFPHLLDDAIRDGDSEKNVRLGQRIRRG